jgi:hypothetical protein
MNVLRTNNTQATKISLRLAVAEAVSGALGRVGFLFFLGLQVSTDCCSGPSWCCVLMFANKSRKTALPQSAWANTKNKLRGHCGVR